MDKTNIEVVDNTILDYSKKLFHDMKFDFAQTNQR